MGNKAVLIIVTVLLLLGLAVYVVKCDLAAVTNDDCCLVIAWGITDSLKNNIRLTDEAIRQIQKDLIEGSIINGKINGEGKPVDYNGNPFVITISKTDVTVETVPSFWQFGISRETSRITDN